MERNLKKNVIKTCKDLKVYRYSYEAAMKIFYMSRKFPQEEKYSLTDQIIRSSRSVPANIREGYAKRKYEQVFIKHLVDAIGSSEETRTWLDFARDCQYLSSDIYSEIDKKYKEIGSMLYGLIKNWKTFGREEDRGEKIERRG